jgi:signal transduction histidine kinase
MYSDKNIKVECDIVENLNVHIDRWSFRIVLKNLIQNAFKYNNNWGTVKIHLCEKCLSIEDNWIWMTEEQTKKIFDNFYKWSENSDGFGLGLYLVKKILWICWYNIDVKSKVWEWTKFKILFNK